MRLIDLIVRTAVLDGGPDVGKAELFDSLLTLLADDGHISPADVPAVRDAVMRRERQGSTGGGQCVAIPHTKHPAVSRPVGVLAKCRTPVEFAAIDGEPVDIILYCLFPTDRPEDQVKLASGLLLRLRDESFRERLRRAGSAEELSELVKRDGGMTRHEWQACKDPHPMLRYLLGLRADELRVQDIEAFPNCLTSDRKLRLFACACYHRIGHLLADEQARVAVALAERVADGGAGADELDQAFQSLYGGLGQLEYGWRQARGAQRQALAPRHHALALALQICRAEAPTAAYYAASNAGYAVADITAPAEPFDRAAHDAIRGEESRAQPALLRCVFGPHPAEPPAFEERWRTPDVVAVARRIYDERDFGALPVLADALTDAGCDAEDVFAHLRGVGAHVRGCWVVDLALGLE